MKLSPIFLVSLIALAGFTAPCARAQDSLQISEIMAANNGPFADEDGEFSDWIEIHNPGTNAVDLNGWYLTDDSSKPRQWRFPATSLPPNGYLVVFASNKDRRAPGSPLHTNFKLSASGEYLALVKPDGATIASVYTPAFPAQVERVSYGIPLQENATNLVATGAQGRLLVPTSGAQGEAWLAPEYDDSTWMSVRTGVGFETGGQSVFVPQLMADSVADFSGVQGNQGWFYGYWDRGAANGQAYSDGAFIPFPSGPGPFSQSNYWDGSSWHWYNGNPPYTSLSAQGGHPNAKNGDDLRADHWPIRRYVSETNGLLKISGTLTHRSGWVYVTATGVASSSILYIYPTAAGDGYIDDLKLVAGSTPEAGANLLANGNFEAGLSSWTVSANLSGSSAARDSVHEGTNSLHFVASSGGSSQSSSIYQTVSPALVSGQTYTLSYWYLPGTTPAPLVIRFSGSWINSSPTYCGDGVVGRVFVDGTEVMQQSALVSTVNYAVTVPVQTGSRIDFALDPGSNDNDYCDAATFTAQLETADPNLMVVADSVADWSLTGRQGEKNWYYGYYNKTDDAGRVYQVSDFTPFPRDTGPHSAQNFWTGSLWDWYAGNQPWDEIGQTAMHPNGSNSGKEHWMIRRWVSQASGRVTVEWTLAKSNPAGNGVTGRLMHNGNQVDVVTISGADSTGVRRIVTLTNVLAGDFLDLALDATGVGGATDDSSDGSVMTMVVRGKPSLGASVATDLKAAMQGINPGAYLRIPFQVADPSSFQFLTLRMQFDDGFMAYLNGVGVAARNTPIAPEELAWSSVATANRADTDATRFETFDLSAYTGLLRPGTNVLAIHGLNASAGDEDFLLLPELRGSSVSFDPEHPLYFVTPSPGQPNGRGNTNFGPIIVNADHTPNVPKIDQLISVTAEVQPTFNPVTNVLMTYRVMYGTETNVVMFDDGQHGDGRPGDRLYGALIPAGAGSNGVMIRYYVTALDSRGQRTRFPAFEDPNNSPEYLGTIIHNPVLTNPLPVLHWFMQNPSAADSDTGTRGSLFFEGRFYDNIYANLHGQSARGFPKKSYDLDFNPGYKFQWNKNEILVDDINMLTTWPDKTYMRNMLTYGSYRDADGAYHFVQPIRVQLNGAFYSVAHFVENGDENYLKRLGLDPNGALYKMYNGFNTLSHTVIQANSNAEKKTRKNEGNADLVDLYNGLSLAGQPLAQYIFDNINVPQVISFLAGHVLAADEDCCHKNYYFYRDSDGSGEWQMMPWDADLTFGRTWTDDANHYNYYDPRIFATNFHSQNTLGIGGGNLMASKLWSIPGIYQMYLRRVRSITDEQLQPPLTHPYLLHYEGIIDQWAEKLAPDAALDLAKWGSWSPVQTLEEAIAALKYAYLAPRRQWIYTTLSYTNGGPYMAPQPTDTMVNLGTIESNPTSGNQDQEYIQLVNTNSFPVDLSGWRLSGAISFKFRGGTVLPTNGMIYVSPNVKAFRARTTGPRGGQGLYVLGNYEGRLSAWGETVQLLDNSGRVVDSATYAGNPSPAQRYLRITEIMFHPPEPPPGMATYREEFEYIELKNIGPVDLNLTGVRFTAGIDYNFTGSSVTNLAAGQSVVVVRNVAAFASRYGTGPLVAGAYDGFLDNGGERLRLEDARGEKILEFEYDGDWEPVADGPGFALAVRDESAAWYTWGMATNWTHEAHMIGSPGANNSAPAPISTVLINEVLSNTDLPATDSIELYNPTAAPVDIGGWFLTDDFNAPRKFRIPSPTVIPAGGYVVFTEADFNAVTLPLLNRFSLGSDGDETYLFSGDASTNLTGYWHGFDFGAAETGVSFGRHVTSLGEERLVAQRTNTLGAANAGPRVGPIVISEIVYHPPDLADGSDNQDLEFVELRNVTATAVPLFDPIRPANSWHLDGGVTFQFPSALSLDPGARLLVVSFNPTNAALLAHFRSYYGVPPEVAILGPYSGKLDNSTDKVRLTRPEAPDTQGKVPKVLVDAVNYTDLPPWPAGADGFGTSLQRRSLAEYGDDPANWMAGVPTVGQDSGTGTTPVITVQPIDQTVLEFETAEFRVTATGSSPLRYQWQRDGQNVEGATNAVLRLESVRVFTDATYRVVVFNSAGSAVSSNAALVVRFAAAILSAPQNQGVFPYHNATFSVTAGSSSPLRYRWLFNGAELPGATGSSLVLTNVQFSHEGDYQVVVTDNVGDVVTPPARLTVLRHPLIVTQPVNTAVSVLNPANRATLSVTATSSTPMRYQWRFYGTNLIGATNSTLIMSNLQTWMAGPYSVEVSDSFGPVLSDTAILTLNVRPAFTVLPISQTVPAGGSVSFSASWTGSQPVTYRWRVGSTTLGGWLVPTDGYAFLSLSNGYAYGNLSNSVLVLTNVTLSVTGRYNIVVTNVAGSVVTPNAILLAQTDADRDGLPDEWEAGRPGFSTSDPADGLRDNDGDGMSNAAEFIAGTDPLDPQSYLKVEAMPGEETGVSFVAVSNRTYTVLFSDGLNPVSWQRLADVLGSTNSGPARVLDPQPGPNRFYRLVTPGQP